MNFIYFFFCGCVFYAVVLHLEVIIDPKTNSLLIMQLTSTVFFWFFYVFVFSLACI